MNEGLMEGHDMQKTVHGEGQKGTTCVTPSQSKPN